MAIIERDYGYTSGSSAPSNTVNTTHHSQVYHATHDGAGNRLPFMNRSFISFTWGGKHIEDFDLLATIENNALQRQIYSSFDDNVTESDVWDGQIYWDTHFKARTIGFTLATDGITERQLDEFKNWFQPGIARELVLSEHPNRGIMARIQEAPSYNMLPFESSVTIKIAGEDYTTSTTLYKGQISIRFVMDDPFWYSLSNILDRLETGNTSSHWIDANGNSAYIYTDKDALKVLQEDGVPFSGMFSDSQPTILTGAETNYVLDLSDSAEGSLVDYMTVDFGHVAYALVSTTVPLNDTDVSYCYYAGTAPCRPLLHFTLTPTVNAAGYISVPSNSYVDASTPYNTIYAQCTETQEFHFTTPSIWTGYNQVIKIFSDEGFEDVAWEELRIAIRDNVKHWAPRAYANYVINNKKGTTIKTTAALLTQCKTMMRQFLQNSSNEDVPATFTIDGKSGYAQGNFQYRNTNDNLVTLSSENVGDMVRSNHFILKERNIANENGYIQAWTDEAPQYSYKLSADCNLQNFNIQYKYLYF